MNEASKKMCPMVQHSEYCHEEGCAWWVTESGTISGRCAVLVAAERLDDMMIDGLPVNT